MADLSRSVAPYLPPEITSRILHSICLRGGKECGTLSTASRISNAWRGDSQKLLFTSISIDSIIKLKQLVEGIQPGLMQHILYLECTTRNDYEDYPRLAFLSLQHSLNLKFLKLDLPPDFAFEPSHDIILRSSTPLRHLTRLQVKYRGGIGLDTLISCAPNLESLELGMNQGIGGGEVPYTSTLNNLKELILTVKGNGFLKLWNVTQFQGLEKLSVKDVPMESVPMARDVSQFFKTIAPTLLEFKIHKMLMLSSFSMSSFRQFVALQHLTIGVTDAMPMHLPSSMPPSLKHFSIIKIPKTPILSLFGPNNLFHPEVLEIHYLEEVINLADLPPLRKLIIRAVQVQTLLSMLRSVVSRGENFNVEELVLGKWALSRSWKTNAGKKMPLFTDVEIQLQCKEMGLTLNEFVE